MTQLIDIRKVEIGPKYLTARVRIATSAPLMTSDDLEGTTRVYRLMPHIIEHLCLGDGGETFKDVMGDTEIAHLLEHVTVEILAQSDIAGDITCGRTYEVTDEHRTYDIEFPCPDDVLVIGALSSAVWILQWAYTGGGEPSPDVDATVQGLVDLIQSLPEPEPPLPPIDEYVVEGEEARAILAELAQNKPELEEPFEGEEPLETPAWLPSEDEELAAMPEEYFEPDPRYDPQEITESESGFAFDAEFAPEPQEEELPADEPVKEQELPYEPEPEPEPVYEPESEPISYSQYAPSPVQDYFDDLDEPNDDLDATFVSQGPLVVEEAVVESSIDSEDESVVEAVIESVTESEDESIQTEDTSVLNNPELSQWVEEALDNITMSDHIDASIEDEVNVDDEELPED